MRPTLGLDIDGVLADFSRAFRVRANAMFGVPVHGAGAQPTWHPHDLTDEQNTAVWATVDFKFWHTGLEPIATHAEIADLTEASRQFTIKYVTARNPVGREATRLWLRDHGFPQGRLTLATDKVSSLVKVPGLRGFLDDSPSGVDTMYRAGLPVYVRDWPYNRDIVHENIPRVYSITEFLHAVEPYHDVR